MTIFIICKKKALKYEHIIVRLLQSTFKKLIITSIVQALFIQIIYLSIESVESL